MEGRIGQTLIQLRYVLPIVRAGSLSGAARGLSRHTVREEIEAGELVAVAIEDLHLHRTVQLATNLHRINETAVRAVSRLIVEGFERCW